MNLPPDLLSQARRLVADRLGLDLSSREQDLESALGRLLAASGSRDADLAWLRALTDESPPWQRLASELTVGETCFFRDKGVFDALETRVLPALVAERRAAGIPRLRLWCAACASGEEAYSLAILLERTLPDRADWSVTLLATDVNPRALETARLGIYREWSLRQTPEDLRAVYFRPLGDGRFELLPRLRRSVSFAPLNLATDTYPDGLGGTMAMDLILCRNVLMYFTEDVRRATVVRLRRALVPGGWLAVSPAEASAELFRAMVPVQWPDAIFYRRPGGAEMDPVLACATESVSAPALAVAPPPSPPAQELEPEVQAASVAPAPSFPRDRVAEALGRARELADRGRLAEARVLCEAALSRDRLNAETYVLFATIRQEEGDVPAAVHALRRALYLAPDLAAGHFALGSLLFRMGRPRLGRRSLETAVRLLEPLPGETPVAGAEGLTAARLRHAATAYLERS
jgi:chemotaxis protein methyltransferase CheR